MAEPIGQARAESAEAARRAMVAAEQCLEDVCVGQPCPCAVKIADRAVAAFLRALPERFPMPGARNPDCQVWGHAKGEMHRVAAAVEAAGRE